MQIGVSIARIPTHRFLVDSRRLTSQTPLPHTRAALRPGHRVQDPDITSLADHGMCLSMHQPWASLLTAGIKTVEGRPWPTNHRGMYVAENELKCALLRVHGLRFDCRVCLGDLLRTLCSAMWAFR